MTDVYKRQHTYRRLAITRFSQKTYAKSFIKFEIIRLQHDFYINCRFKRGSKRIYTIEHFEKTIFIQRVSVFKLLNTGHFKICKFMLHVMSKLRGSYEFLYIIAYIQNTLLCEITLNHSLAILKINFLLSLV